IGGAFLIKHFSFSLTEWDDIEVAQTPSERPNILLLVAEDLSARVHAFGDSLATTPNIDALAKIGVRYPNTFTTAGVCSPSRAALMMGVHQISFGGQHMRTATRPEGAYLSVPPQEMKAFPELLRRAGYFTFNTAKQDYQFSGAMPGSGPFTIWDEENDPDLWRNRREGQPFFGMLNFLETHETGLFPPLGHRPKNMQQLLIQLFRTGLESSDIEVPLEEIKIPPYFADTKTVRQDMARHYQNIHAMDGIVGNLMDKLKRDGLLESTIVIWTTDHGDCLPRGKRELYDSGIKVPMIIYWPEKFRPVDVQPGTIDERMISFVDFAPTFLSLAAAPIPDYLHGSDLANDSLARSFIYASRDRIDEVRDRQRAIRDQRFKYIRSWYPQQEGGHRLAFRDNLPMMEEFWKLKVENKLDKEQLIWFEDPGEERLFDLKNDPFELNDISKDSAYTEDLLRMRNALDDWLISVEDWSEESENEMVLRFQPQGITEQTPTPEMKMIGDMLEISAKDGASIGYQIEGGKWELYTEPISLEEGQSLKAKAIRYGWEESEVQEYVAND
ncbi:MAG: sulfatase, partial [Bacteroidota bacterium]